ncbi:MAG TPA: hypothetical protein VMW53_12630 [archaeon]|nr:hypothetical protein [archaeon]
MDFKRLYYYAVVAISIPMAEIEKRLLLWFGGGRRFSIESAVWGM